MCASSLPVTLNKREAFVSIIEEEIIEERVKRQQQRQTNSITTTTPSIDAIFDGDRLEFVRLWPLPPSLFPSISRKDDVRRGSNTELARR